MNQDQLDFEGLNLGTDVSDFEGGGDVLWDISLQQLMKLKLLCFVC